MAKRKTTKPARSLLLRTCGPNGESHNGFKWPLKVGAKVKAPDWNPRAECDNGLHGLLDGAGDGGLLRHEKDSVWMVVSALTKSIVALRGKVKMPEARIEFVGDRRGATDYLIAHGAKAENIIGAFIQVGDNGRAVGAAYSTVSGGYGATVSGGYGASLSLKWFDGTRHRFAVAYVGEDGIKPNTKYRLNDKQKFVEVA